jgi:type II secretory pathway pseudopilin PulG
VGAAHLGKQDLLCSLIGLGVKLGLVMVTGVSLVRVASAYQARMDRQGELAAVLQIENAQLTKAQQRFDRLFLISGEKTLAREQSQWIAPNRLRVVWQAPAAPTKAPAAPAKASATPSKAAENAPDPAPQRAPGPLASAPLKDSAKVPPTGTGGLAQQGDLGGN